MARFAFSAELAPLYGPAPEFVEWGSIIVKLRVRVHVDARALAGCPQVHKLQQF